MHYNWDENKNKASKSERSKNVSFANAVIVYIFFKNLRNHHKTIRIKKFSKLQDTENNIQK